MTLLLFLNGDLGLKVLSFFAGISEHKIAAVVLNSEDKRTPDYLENIRGVLELYEVDIPIILWGNETFQLEKIVAESNFPIYGVSALFGHVIPLSLIKGISGGILNLHPSLLPFGRGANPISWGILKEQPQGISLHLVDEHLDTGDILFQKEIYTTINMSAGEIYELAMIELFQLFTEYFPKWVSKEQLPTPQKNIGTSAHHSRELKALEVIKSEEVASFNEFVKRLQATTFSDGRRPLFRDSMGKIWVVDFKISKFHKFGEK